VSGTIYFLWHTGQQAAYGQWERTTERTTEGNGADKKSGHGFTQRALLCKPSRDVDSRKPFLTVMLNQGSAEGDTGETGIVMQTKGLVMQTRQIYTETVS
jgi:hypothetical protein